MSKKTRARFPTTGRCRNRGVHGHAMHIVAIEPSLRRSSCELIHQALIDQVRDRLPGDQIRRRWHLPRRVHHRVHHERRPGFGRDGGWSVDSRAGTWIGGTAGSGSIGIIAFLQMPSPRCEEPPCPMRDGPPYRPAGSRISRAYRRVERGVGLTISVSGCGEPVPPAPCRWHGARPAPSGPRPSS